MTIDKAMNLIEGVKDHEERKFNLSVSGASYSVKRHGSGEMVEIRCKDGLIKLCSDGRISPIFNP